MTLLVFGKTGQVATELALLEPAANCLGRDQVDLSDPESCATAIRAHQPTGVINAAAYTAVDRAEVEENLAMVINGQAPGAMAQACAGLDIPFVHISTDYVFDGSNATPWVPDDPTGPLGVYGQSKLMGEKAVRAAGGAYVILRTSWVFSAHGTNFLKTMLRLGAERDRLTIVADQVGGPTPAGAIATACLQVIDIISNNRFKSGVYHFTGAPDVSWADFARAIFTASGQQVAVEEILTSAYPTPAQRPANSRLDCAATETEFGITRPAWQDAVQQIVRQIL